VSLLIRIAGLAVVLAGAYGLHSAAPDAAGWIIMMMMGYEATKP
jgi:hypothetical protein